MANPTVIAFDVDNTLHDPEMRAYRNTVSSVLESVDLGLSPDDAYDIFESSRAAGHALERLGLKNPIHDRGCPHGLATLCLINCTGDAQRRAFGISAAKQNSWKDSFSRLIELDRQTRSGALDSRLQAERETRAVIQTDDLIRGMRDEVVRLAGHPIIVEASQRYKAIEASQPVESRAKLMASLVARGFSPVIITEGRTTIQMEKITRCGIDASWSSRVLITEDVAGVPGLTPFDEVLSQYLDAESVDPTAPPTPGLSKLWHYRCLIDAWAHKTPWFFARCLHAIQMSPNAPCTAVQPPVYVKDSDWTPFRFVMVGDRYDKDIEPIVDLLQPGAGLTIRLRMGKYAHLHPEDSIAPARRPGRTFTDWESLAEFLLKDLNIDSVPPVVHPPDLMDRDLITPQLIEFGKQSDLEAVRATASVLHGMMEDSTT